MINFISHNAYKPFNVCLRACVSVSVQLISYIIMLISSFMADRVTGYGSLVNRMWRIS